MLTCGNYPGPVSRAVEWRVIGQTPLVTYGEYRTLYYTAMCVKLYRSHPVVPPQWPQIVGHASQCIVDKRIDK